MSAYAHQMEREYSAQSLESGDDSEVGNRYVMESGFYMTSLAATIFIAALVTVGVLLITLLIALTVMLQSCQDRSKGVVEIQKRSSIYDYCKIFAQHAELNSLGQDDLPPICRSSANQRIKEGRYERDLNVSLGLVERYYEGIVPSDDGLDAILIDIDDIFSSSLHAAYPLMHRLREYGCTGCFKEAKKLKEIVFLRLYMKLQDSGWPLILFSRKPEKQRNATIEHLVSAGYSDWSSVIMRLDDEMDIASHDYFSKRRAVIQEKGFRISGVISSQMDALIGLSIGGRIFKLPNPTYYYFEHWREISVVTE